MRNNPLILAMAFVLLLAVAMFNAQPIAAAPATRTAPPPSKMVVDGIEIHLGLTAAEKLRGYPQNSVEARMHGGVPSGAGYYHVNVSLIDAAKQSPITGARVEVEVEEPGIGTEHKVLEPMTINQVSSYGTYVRLAAGKPYWFKVRVRKLGYQSVTEAKFQPWTD